jgi:hypothetical protein
MKQKRKNRQDKNGNGDQSSAPTCRNDWACGHNNAAQEQHMMFFCAVNSPTDEGSTRIRADRPSQVEKGGCVGFDNGRAELRERLGVDDWFDQKQKPSRAFKSLNNSLEADQCSINT